MGVVFEDDAAEVDNVLYDVNHVRIGAHALKQLIRPHPTSSTRILFFNGRLVGQLGRLLDSVPVSSHSTAALSCLVSFTAAFGALQSSVLVNRSRLIPCRGRRPPSLPRRQQQLRHQRQLLSLVGQYDLPRVRRLALLVQVTVSMETLVEMGRQDLLLA